MHIHELILEGFKSYPIRTQITGWDPSFNAITGLNGSGKSNILDAICFVLGLTNMSSLRAQNQQDLIYKRGQAGVTKASVTIVFDNTDSTTSPVGYEAYPQITVTRQIGIPNLSKYLLNGHKSTQQHIRTFFQGVQLNINNPNFLIMQGRITKVLNMRPQEILGMVEEAAGTRMFEEKKEKAFRDMSKKDKDLKQRESELGEEITPKLNKLREEKRVYLSYQKTCTELERTARILRAWEWVDARRRAKRAEDNLSKSKEELAVLQKKKSQNDKSIAAAEKKKNEVNAQRDKELKKGGKFKKLEDEVSEHGKASAKLRTQVEIKHGTITDEEGKVVSSETELQQLGESLQEKRLEVQRIVASYKEVKDKHDGLQNALTSAEELLQTLLTGLSSNNGANNGGGYLGQIADAKSRAAQARAEEEQSRMKLSMNEKELVNFEARWKAVEREAKDGTRKLEEVRATVANFKRRVEETGWSTEKEHLHETALRDTKNEVRRLVEHRDAIKRTIPNVDFEYDASSLNFDLKKIKGTVASLVSLDEVHYNKSTALEITAGGRLYNVVVESDEVGKQLLGTRLKKRVTLIPLNRIESFRVKPAQLAAAERIAGDKARLALSLVGYPQEVVNAMYFVFGGTFICDDAETAKKITFSREIGVRSVTLQGDVYDPSGTLSGGAAPKVSGDIIKVQKLLEVQGKLQEAEGRLAQLQRDEERSRGAREQWKSLSRELSMKEHELNLLQEQVNGSNASRIGAEVEQAKKTIADMRAAIEEAKEKEKAANADVKKLEKDMNDFKHNKTGKTDELKANIAKQKAAVQKHSVEVKAKHRELQTANLELEQLEKDIVSAERRIEEARDGVQKLHKELAKMEADLKNVEDRAAEAEKRLQEERATLNQYDEDLRNLELEIKTKNDDNVDQGIKIGEQQKQIAALQNQKTTAENNAASLEKQYAWIVEEQEQFGKRGGQYEFTANIEQLRTKAQELQAIENSMQNKVNQKAIHMLQSVEKNEADIKKMISQVLKDKASIEATIETLDKHKRETVDKTWQKVNGDFGGIFSELLPGNFAKLEPTGGQDMMQGLEVKVRLGTVWKESLTELSGGQRSLIALSLIMSLLQFKPAPMYILDEIDAALDLSHTQHIGQLFRTRFKGSQFIVVSLKEGLFTNANVLFRTRFRDGTSIVERTAHRSTSALYQQQNGGRGDEAENVPPHGRRARKQ